MFPWSKSNDTYISIFHPITDWYGNFNNYQCLRGGNWRRHDVQAKLWYNIIVKSSPFSAERTSLAYGYFNLKGQTNSWSNVNTIIPQSESITEKKMTCLSHCPKRKHFKNWKVAKKDVPMSVNIECWGFIFSGLPCVMVARLACV